MTILWTEQQMEGVIYDEGYLLVLDDWVLANGVMPRSDQDDWAWLRRSVCQASQEGTRFSKKGYWSKLECPSWSLKFKMCDCIWFKNVSSFHWLMLHIKSNGLLVWLNVTCFWTSSSWFKCWSKFDVWQIQGHPNFTHLRNYLLGTKRVARISKQWDTQMDWGSQQLVNSGFWSAYGCPSREVDMHWW